MRTRSCAGTRRIARIAAYFRNPDSLFCRYILSKSIIRLMSLCGSRSFWRSCNKELKHFLANQCKMLFKFIASDYHQIWLPSVRVDEWAIIASNKLSQLYRVKQCELILSLLPAKMCQSHSFTVRLYWVNEKILVPAFCWLAGKK